MPHKRLLVKLRGYCISGKLLAWIEAFVTGRKQRVEVNGSRSSSAKVLSGIPQGGVLGPMLFICYINDMPSIVDSPIYLFADDTKVFISIASVDDHSELQHDLEQLEKWSEKWQLSFNANKCKVNLDSAQATEPVLPASPRRHDRDVQVYTHAMYNTDLTPLQIDPDFITRGHSYKLKKERCATRIRSNFFRHRITNRWNNLSEDTVSAPSLNISK